MLRCLEKDINDGCQQQKTKKYFVVSPIGSIADCALLTFFRWRGNDFIGLILSVVLAFVSWMFSLKLINEIKI
jgi:hypothetical protein